MADEKKPLYPPDPRRNRIQLPKEIEDEIRLLVSAGKVVEAVKRVLELTGAGLKRSKDYVDQLTDRRPGDRKP
jgi:hypothetical protein